jgi:hypothetical protein
MFSYVPCQPASTCKRGFARPNIKIRPLITTDLSQGKRSNKRLELPAVAKYWENVREQVEAAGCWLGVSLERPPRRSSKG